MEVERKAEIVKFLKNNKVEIEEVDLLSRAELRNTAKEREIPTGLNLSELRERLRRPIPAVRRKKQPIMDESVPLINAEILVPQQVPLEPPRTKRLARLANQTVETFSDWLDWLKNAGKNVAKKVNPKLEELKEKIKSFWEKKKDFVVKEGRSALKGFAKQYSIEGQEGFSPRDFLREVKPKVVEFFEKKKKTKKILSCLMSTTNIATGEEIEEIADFHSLIETNLEATNEGEMYDEMVERMLEKLANFQKQGSNWRFERVKQLEIHFVKFTPLRGSSWIDLPDELKAKKQL